jgi:hypothetical protein
VYSDATLKLTDHLESLMLRTFLTSVLIVLVGLLGAALVFLEPLIGRLVPELMAGTGLQLTYSKLEVEPLRGHVSLENLVLKKVGDEAPILTLAAASATVTPMSLIRLDMQSAILSATNIDIFLKTEQEKLPAVETSSGFEPGVLAEYAPLIPGNISIADLQLHWQTTEGELLSEIHDLSVLPGENKTTSRVVASGVHLNTDLTLRGTLTEHGENSAGERHSSLKVDLDSKRQQTHLKLNGDLRLTEKNVQYSAQTDAMMEDIDVVFRTLGIDFDLHGTAHVQGELTGDLQGLKIEASRVSLDHGPNYRLDGRGTFSYQFGQIPELATQATAVINDQQQLSRWTGVDLSALGVLSARAQIDGPVNDLILSDSMVTATSETGLEIEVGGKMQISEIQSLRLGENRGLNLRASAPQLASLREWFEVPELDIGKWEVRAHARQQDGKLLIKDISINAQNGTDLHINGMGGIADVQSLLEGDLEQVEGVALQFTLDSSGSRLLSDPFSQGIPELGSVQASAEISGSLTSLVIDQIALSTGQALQSKLAVNGGSVQLSVTPDLSYQQLRLPLSVQMKDTSQLSQLIETEIANFGELQATAILRQTKSDFSLEKLDLKLKEQNESVVVINGKIISLETLGDLELKATVTGLNTAAILQTMRQGLGEDFDLGQLHGNFSLNHNRGIWHLQKLKLENRNSDQLSFLLAGSAKGNLSGLNIDLQVQSEINDQALLADLTGLAMKPIRNSLHIKGSEQRLNIVGNVGLGNTHVDTRLSFQLGQQGLSSLSGSITSQAIYLEDLGLSQLLAVKPNEATESENSVQATTDPALPFDLLPTYDLDTIVFFRTVYGRDTAIEDVTARLIHEKGKYRLGDFAVQFPGGLLKADAALDLNSPVPSWSLQGQMQDFRIERLLHTLGAESDMQANFNALANLRSEGSNRNEILAAINGDTAIAIEEVVIKGAAFDQLATDTVAWFFTGGVLVDETRFDCVMGDFSIQDGLVVSDSLFAESDHLIADGNLKLDLETQNIDMAITPRSKKRTLQIPGTIKVTGDITNPRISTPAIVAGADAAAQVALIAPTIALRAFDTTLNLLSGDGLTKEEAVKVSPCQAEQAR